MGIFLGNVHIDICAIGKIDSIAADAAYFREIDSKPGRAIRSIVEGDLKISGVGNVHIRAIRADIVIIPIGGAASYISEARDVNRAVAERAACNAEYREHEQDKYREQRQVIHRTNTFM